MKCCTTGTTNEVVEKRETAEKRDETTDSLETATSTNATSSTNACLSAVSSVWEAAAKGEFESYFKRHPKQQFSQFILTSVLARLDAGLDVDSMDANKQTVLFHVVQASVNARDSPDAYLTLIVALIRRGANVNAMDRRQRSPLSIAAKNKAVSVAFFVCHFPLRRGDL